MSHIFTDTDILLDFLSGRQPFATNAARIFELIHRGHIIAYTSSLSFSNLYYILRRKHPHQNVIEKLAELTVFLKIINVSEKVIIAALHSQFRDFEDAIQYQSAQSIEKIGVIITRNIKDYKKAEIPVMTPETFLGTIESSSLH
jgi:predicted nucleic acid-binding protein